MKIKSEKSNTIIQNQPVQITDEDWTSMYKDNFAAIRQFVLTNNGSEQQAEDIYHDAFIAAWRNVQLGKYEYRSEQSLSGYILTIGKNKWIDVLRSAHNKKTVLLAGELESKESDDKESDEEQEIRLVKEQFKNLGENCRQLLVAFYYQKQSMRKISVEKGWTEATTRNNKYRCLQKLRELINQNIP